MSLTQERVSASIDGGAEDDVDDDVVVVVVDLKFESKPRCHFNSIWSRNKTKDILNEAPIQMGQKHWEQFNGHFLQL